MRIRYLNSPEDHIRFTQFERRNKAGSIQKIKESSRDPLRPGWVKVLLVFGIVLLWSFVSNSLALPKFARFALYIGVGGGLVMIWLVILYAKYREKDIYEKCFSGNFGDPGLGEHEIVIDGEGVRDKTKLKECFFNWQGIYQIIAQPEFVYIYFGPATALIIPKDKMVEGDFEEFVIKLKEMFDKSRREINES